MKGEKEDKDGGWRWCRMKKVGMREWLRKKSVG